MPVPRPLPRAPPTHGQLQPPDVEVHKTPTPPVDAPTQTITISPAAALAGAEVTLTTTPDAPAKEHKSGPTIGGSQGGFIGLVVGLGVLVIVSSIAVFCLLKHRKGGGNPRKRQAQERSMGPTTVGGQVEMDFPNQQGRLATTFGGRSRTRNGWGRTNSTQYDALSDDDTWDTEYDPGQAARFRESQAALHAMTAERPIGLRQDSSATVSTVRIDTDVGTRPKEMVESPTKDPHSEAETVQPRFITSASFDYADDFRRRQTDESTLVSPTTLAHPYGSGGSKFHEIIT